MHVYCVCVCVVQGGAVCVALEIPALPHHAYGQARSIIKRVLAWLGLAGIIYIRFIYGIIGREITEYTVIYGVYIRF